ncbi:MAG: hypothetical protein CMP84_00475 [Gammaproteobacteria bacterium]|nr:hypothetical protein [Gammaproteobacteria bacterium]
MNEEAVHDFDIAGILIEKNSSDRIFLLVCKTSRIGDQAGTDRPYPEDCWVQPAGMGAGE